MFFNIQMFLAMFSFAMAELASFKGNHDLASEGFLITIMIILLAIAVRLNDLAKREITVTIGKPMPEPKVSVTVTKRDVGDL